MGIYNIFSKGSGSGSASVVMSGGNGNVVVVNGVRHNLPNGNISINGSKIYVNGTLWNGSDELNSNCKPLEITIEGNCGEMKGVNGSVSVKGNVEGDVNCDGSFNGSTVSKNVSCGGSFNGENVGGNVNAGGSVRCGDIKGNLNAGGSVRHG